MKSMTAVDMLRFISHLHKRLNCYQCSKQSLETLQSQSHPHRCLGFFDLLPEVSQDVLVRSILLEFSLAASEQHFAELDGGLRPGGGRLGRGSSLRRHLKLRHHAAHVGVGLAKAGLVNGLEVTRN